MMKFIDGHLKLGLGIESSVHREANGSLMILPYYGRYRWTLKFSVVLFFPSKIFLQIIIIRNSPSSFEFSLK